MSLEESLIEFYIMSLPWNEYFTYFTAINSLKIIKVNQKVLRENLDELNDLDRTGDTDVYEFLEIPYFSTRTGRNGYRPALNLCYENSESGYLELTDFGEKLFNVPSFDEKIKIVFLLSSYFYPHVRALLMTMFSKKVYFKSTQEDKMKFPNSIKKYFILKNQKSDIKEFEKDEKISLDQIVLNVWEKDNNLFLKNFFSENNFEIFQYLEGNLKTKDNKKLDISNVLKVEFNQKDFSNNVFNRFTAKCLVNILGLQDQKNRGKLYEIKNEAEDYVSIKLRDDIKKIQFQNISMKSLLPSNLIKSEIEEIDETIIENYSLNEFYSLDEILYDLKELGYNKSNIEKWKLNIEKNQVDSNTFNSELLTIKTKSGVMGSKGLKNKTKHSKLKFLYKEVK